MQTNISLKPYNTFGIDVKAYRFSACVLQWDYSTLYKKRIPKIKLMQVAGGFQTDLMEEDLDEK